MLREAVDWLVTPSLPFARRTGHLSEFVAIAARRRRHAVAWAPHEARSRAAVLRAAQRADPGSTAVILGAGHLYDVPLAALAGQFREVRLVDLAFAPATRRAARSFGNVVCVTHDVTESLPTLLTVAAPSFLLDDAEIGFVASVNLVSQLSVVPTRRLDDEAGDRLARALVEAHVAWLRRLPCPVAMVFDRTVEIVERGGGVVASIDPLNGAFAPDPHETWIWDIAPLGEIDRDHAVRHLVAAVDRL